MNRSTPQSIPSPRRIAPAILAAVVLLAMLPLLTRGADAVPGPTIDVVIEDSWPTSIWEPGAKASFGIEVTNTSPGPVTITAATESLDGSAEFDISEVHGAVLHTTCNDIVGTILAAGATYDCHFMVFVGGDVGDVLTDIVTVTAQDGGGITGSDQGQRSYTILDALPTIGVTKSANPTSVTEPGADVTYTATVTNTSPEPVTITAATESIDGGPAVNLGTINGPILQTTCGDAVGTTLDPEDAYSCSYLVRVYGTGGDVNTDTVKFTVQEDEGNSTNGQAAKTFTILDSAAAVWGVNASDRIYAYTGAGWLRMPGRLAQVDVGNNGEVWGVNDDGNVYRYAGNGNWTRMPGRLTQVSVGSRSNGSSLVMGINAAGRVYRYDAGGWTRLSGRLAQVEAGNKGEVWGVNHSQAVYKYAGANSWTRMPGVLKQVSVGSNPDGSMLVWGVNPSDKIYRYAANGTWTRISGSLDKIDVGTGQVWGVNSSDKIYRYAGNGSWTRIAGSLDHVSAGT